MIQVLSIIYPVPQQMRGKIALFNLHKYFTTTVPAMADHFTTGDLKIKYSSDNALGGAGKV